MAGPAPPDPTAFKSWEDAFQYPLPVVLKLSQQLRTNLSSNREKLRSLVGTSYRELLGTAERIVEMDECMRRVEQELGEMGRRCQSEGLERLGENWMRWKADGPWGEGFMERERRRRMVGTKVLGSVLRVAGRVMKGGEAGEALLAAKLLVVGRLLFKSLEKVGEASGLAVELGWRLGGLRKRLLEYVRRIVVGPRVEAARLAEALCGYALVTSAGPTDVLRYFLQVRYEQLDMLGESPSEATLTQMLDLFKRTLLDAQAVFHKLFSESFASLGRGPLLDDEQIQAIHQLNLDLYGSSIDVDVRTFIPWVRHEQLAASDLRKALVSWAQQAIGRLLQAVEVTVQSTTTGQIVVVTREKVIAQFLSLSSTFEDVVPKDSITALRKIFTGKLCSLAEQRARRLSSLLDIATEDSDAASSNNLWSLATADVDLGLGARGFRSAIVQRRHGRSERLIAFNDQLDQWEQDLLVLKELAEGMRAVKWPDKADVDFDEIEDGEALQKGLCGEDADGILSALRSASALSLSDAFRTVQDRYSQQSSAATLLRLVRDLHGRQRSLQQRLQLSDVNVKSSNETTSTLINKISGSIIEGRLERYSEAMCRQFDDMTELWDGQPALPVQPSPSAFDCLTALHNAMSQMGDDLWTPVAVRAISSRLRAGLAHHITGLQLEDTTEPEATKGQIDGQERTEADEATVATIKGKAQRYIGRQHAVQVLFDLLYLDNVFTAKDPGDEALSEAVQAFRLRLNVEEAQAERLQKGAKEYWKRTYMLFGLLARSDQTMQQPYRQH